MQSIRIAVVYLVVGLLGGLAISAIWSGDEGEFGTTNSVADDALELRLAALEERIAAVATDHARLATAVEQLADTAILDDTAFGSGSGGTASDRRAAALGPDSELDAESGASDAGTAGFAPPRRTRDRQRDLVEQLTSAGFSTGDAQLIETRIEELRVEAMQARYEAMRGGESPDDLRSQFGDGSSALRSELGDEQYERFLEATGRPTSVNVTSVLARSAAETAGLQDGDQIVAYDGKRVFDIRELNGVLLEGEPGEPVLVDVVRDGQPMQLVMPRGPLGISSGFARRGVR